ncbi:hypothetical protein KAW48_11540, partial [candidate division WOR-3 bacterium]|nr:hypothetical protein [candidate division WOR-3 bacterium]
MKITKKSGLFLMLLIVFLALISCEKLQELLTTISGNVENEGAAVSGAFILALNGTGDAYAELGNVDELNESSFNALSTVIKGFDLASEANGDYTATLLSGGTVYMVTIKDDGSEKLDSLDLIGWFGDKDSIHIIDTMIADTDTTIIDSTFYYNIPKTITIEKGADTTGCDIDNLLEYKWLLKIQEL